MKTQNSLASIIVSSYVPEVEPPAPQVKHFTSDIPLTTDEVLAEMDRQGYRPLTTDEVLRHLIVRK